MAFWHLNAAIVPAHLAAQAMPSVHGLAAAPKSSLRSPTAPESPDKKPPLSSLLAGAGVHGGLRSEGSLRAPRE